jgi:hypothetical protein
VNSITSPNNGRAMMTDEFTRLTPAQAASIKAVIAMVRKQSGRHSLNLADGSEAYAYPHAGGGISWGLNGGAQGFNVARGVVEG